MGAKFFRIFSNERFYRGENWDFVEAE